MASWLKVDKNVHSKTLVIVPSTDQSCDITGSDLRIHLDPKANRITSGGSNGRRGAPGPRRSPFYSMPDTLNPSLRITNFHKGRC